MAASMLQLIGVMLSALGEFLITAATAMDMWSLQDRSVAVITNVFTYSGLWNSCVGTAYGTTQCRPYFTILGLPGETRPRLRRVPPLAGLGTTLSKGRPLQGIWEVLGQFFFSPFPIAAWKCHRLQKRRTASLRSQMGIWWDISNHSWASRSFTGASHNVKHISSVCA